MFMCVYVCVRVEWLYLSSPLGVSLCGCVYVCAFVSKRRRHRHRTLAIDKQQQRTFHFLFLFFFFLLYFEHPVQQRGREREKGEKAAKVNVDKLGACLWVDG